MKAQDKKNLETTIAKLEQAKKDLETTIAELKQAKTFTVVNNRGDCVSETRIYQNGKIEIEGKTAKN